MRHSSAYELEYTTVLFGIETFHLYLEHAELLLETDNQSSSHPRQLRKNGPCVVRISSLKFKVQHVRDTQNIVADFLSRMFEGQIPRELSISCYAVLRHFSLVFQVLAVLPQQDPELSAIIGKLENKEPHPKYSLFKGIVHCRAISIVGGKSWCRRPRYQCFFFFFLLFSYQSSGRTFGGI
jgi:hypothetical protein